MGTFTIEIETDNAAFGETRIGAARELAIMLHEIARRLARGETEGRVRDVNGNTVGRFTLGRG